MVKLAAFDDRVKEKCDVVIVNQIDARLKILETQIAKQESDVDKKFAQLDSELLKRFTTQDNEISKVTQLEDSIARGDSALDARLNSLENQMKGNGSSSVLDRENVLSDEELIKHVVQEEVNRKTTEERDLENRKRNVIIHRVPEKKMDNVIDRKISDMTYVKDTLDGVFNIAHCW